MGRWAALRTRCRPDKAAVVTATAGGDISCLQSTCAPCRGHHRHLSLHDLNKLTCCLSAAGSPVAGPIGANCHGSRRAVRVCCTKTYLVALNFMFLICGSAMLGVGFWMRVDRQPSMYVEVFHALPSSGPLVLLDRMASVFVFIGGSVALLSFLGCCGACADSACFLCLYALLLCLLLVTQVVVLAVVFVFRDPILKKLELSLEHEIRLEYNKTGRPINRTDYASMMAESHHVTAVMDAIQIKFNCCGAHGPNDYRFSAWYNRTRDIGLADFVPTSCCKLQHQLTDRQRTASSVLLDDNQCQLEAILFPGPTNGPPIFLRTQGCNKSFNEWYQSQTLNFLVFTCIVIILQVLDLCAAGILMAWVRQKHTNCQWSDDSAEFG